jgi:hypothetical protein
MVDIILKLTGQQVNISTANTVNNSTLVRVFAPTDALVTYTNANDDVIGTMTIPSGFVEIMEKLHTDKLSANTTVWATPLAYK